MRHSNFASNWRSWILVDLFHTIFSSYGKTHVERVRPRRGTVRPVCYDSTDVGIRRGSMHLWSRENEWRASLPKNTGGPKKSAEDLANLHWPPPEILRYMLMSLTLKERSYSADRHNLRYSFSRGADEKHTMILNGVSESEAKIANGYNSAYEQGLRILIVGAGIGGLTAAIALRKQGHRVLVMADPKSLAGLRADPLF